ncbi:hypothetical protein BGX30_013146 [Mortierella sp. GBA39]|nr:hypothetical protein BGX30_013146 [Mortierella sp. GBA39]
MTQHYQRTAMAPAMPGMPIIPPRLQQQQQQEMLLNNRRQHPQLYQQQYPQQQQQFRPNHVPGGPLPFTGHTRSVSSGGRPAAPDGYSKNGRRPLNSPISSNNYPHQQHPGNNGDSNGGYNMQQQQQQQGLAGRLRSESNPSYSSNPNNSMHSPGGTRDGVPSRAKSSGTAASGSSFQDRLRERDRERQGREREREEREAAARAIHEDPKVNTAASTNSMTATATAAAAKEAEAAAATTAQSTGTALWNRMRAAKDAINVAITGEERWPDSDDSDHEGESHVSRVLREYSDKKKIEELDRMPIASPLSSSSSTGSNYRNRTLRDAIRQEHGANNSSSPAPTSLASSASSSDYLVRSRRARGETGHLPSRSPSAPLRPIRTREIGQKPAGTLSPPESPASATLPTPTSPNTPSSASLETPRIGNRFRTSSDASLSAALGRLEGKRNQDALVAQVSHLGSTRARSPHRGNRAYREHIDVAPPPPLPTPKSDYRQQRQQPLTPPSSGSSSNTLRSSPSLPSLSSSLSSSRRNGQPVDLGAYGQRQQQQQQTQQARYF